jgi:hypothetical protein
MTLILLVWLLSVVPSIVWRGQLTNTCNDFVCFYVCDFVISLVWGGGLGVLIWCCKMPTMILSSLNCKLLGVWKKKLGWTSTHIRILTFLHEASSWMCQHGMECEGLWRLFFFYFTFILQVESVVGVAANTGHLYFKTCCYYIGEGSFRLSVFPDVPSSHREK